MREFRLAMFCDRGGPPARYKAEIGPRVGRVLDSFNQFKGCEKIWDHRIHIQTLHRLAVRLSLLLPAMCRVPCTIRWFILLTLLMVESER